MTEALIGLGLMMALALLRVPIAISMGVIGFLGVAYLRDWNFDLVDGCADDSLLALGFTAVSRQDHLARTPNSFTGGQPGRWLANPDLLRG